MKTLNLQIAAALGGPLILSSRTQENQDVFKLAGIATSDLPGGTALLSLSTGGHRATYRGRWLEFSPREFELIEALQYAPDRVLTASEARRTLGLAAESRRLGYLVSDINSKSFRVTGAKLIEVDRPRRLYRLMPHSRPVVPTDSKVYLVQGRKLVLGPNQQLAFEGLRLAGRPLNSKIAILESEFLATGLNPYSLKRALTALNHKYEENFGEPIVRLLKWHLFKVKEINIWKDGGFRTLNNEEQALRECDRLLR